MLNPIAALLIEVLEIYKWIVIAAVIVSWLTAFNVINVHNNFVRTLLRILLALTEPVFRQIRRVIPADGRAGPVAHHRVRHHLVPAIHDPVGVVPLRTVSDDGHDH